MAREQVRLVYAPGLDGVRALAVLGVLFFHAGLGWAAGGFIGVSVFFTLSGFLIGSLLIAEATGTEAVNLRRFWARRARRLVPGAIVTTALGVVVAAFFLPSARVAMRGDVIAVLTYVANWRFWQSGRSYAGLFVSPSPLLHFWSLAIEEQLNVVLPLIVIAAMRFGRHREHGLRRLRIVLVSAWVITTALAIVVGASGRRDLAYYGTFTRAPEFLTGMLVACLMLARPKRPSHYFDIVGASGLGALVGIAATITTTTSWLYRGGFAAISLASVAVVVAATQPRGVLSRALARWPLRKLGRISYGVYLYHWPIYLVLSPARTQMRTVPLTLLRIAVTILVASFSYALIESPIMNGRRFRRPRSAVVATGAIAATIASAVFVSATTSAGAAINFEHFRQQLARGPLAATLGASASSGLDAAKLAGGLRPIPSTAASTVPAVSTTVASVASAQSDLEGLPVTVDLASSTSVARATSTTAPVPAGPLRVGVFGDSTGLMTAVGLSAWGESTGRIVVGAAADLGCAVVRGGDVSYKNGSGPVRAATCEWAQSWAQYLDANRVDLAVIQYGPWDVSPRRLAGDSTWRQPGDPVYDRRLADSIDRATRLLTSRGVRVVWLSSPTIVLGMNDGVRPASAYPSSDPTRMKRFNEVMRDVVSKIPGATVYDLAGSLASLPGGENDPRLRPDGVHFSETTAPEVAKWLAPALIDDYRTLTAPPAVSNAR